MHIVLLASLSAVVSFIVNLLIAQMGFWLTQVPKEFPPFTPLPIFSGSLAGGLLATLAYSACLHLFRQPERAFLFVAVVALAVSFSLPLRLSFTKSARFVGVTPAAQMILVLMHAVVAVASVAPLIRQTR